MALPSGKLSVRQELTPSRLHSSLEEFLPPPGASPLPRRLSVDLPSRRLEVYLLGGKVQALVDTSRPLDLEEALSPQELSVSKDLLRDAAFGYTLLSEAASQDFQGSLARLYRGYSLEVGTLLERTLLSEAPFEVLEEDLPQEVAKVLEEWTFLSLPLEALGSEVRERLLAEAILAKGLDAWTLPWDTYILEEGKQKVTRQKSALEEGLLALAPLGVSLQDLADLLGADSLTALLRTLQALVTQGVLTLSVREVAPSDFSPTSESAFMVPGEEQMPPDDDFFEDFSAFEEEEEVLPEDSFMATPHLVTPLESEVKAIMDRDISNPTLKLKLFEYLLKSSKLEADVREVEGELRPRTLEYLKLSASLEELRMEKSLEAMEEDMEDEFEGGVESLEADAAVAEKNQQMNSIFFIIERLERRRHEANEQRREVLDELLTVIPLKEGDPLTAGVHELLEAKLQGISEVKNIAYFPSTPGGTPPPGAPQGGALSGLKGAFAKREEATFEEPSP